MRNQQIYCNPFTNNEIPTSKHEYKLYNPEL